MDPVIVVLFFFLGGLFIARLLRLKNQDSTQSEVESVEVDDVVAVDVAEEKLQHLTYDNEVIVDALTGQLLNMHRSVVITIGNRGRGNILRVRVNFQTAAWYRQYGLRPFENSLRAMSTLNNCVIMRAEDSDVLSAYFETFFFYELLFGHEDDEFEDGFQVMQADFISMFPNGLHNSEFGNDTFAVDRESFLRADTTIVDVTEHAIEIIEEQ